MAKLEKREPDRAEVAGEAATLVSGAAASSPESAPQDSTVALLRALQPTAPSSRDAASEHGSRVRHYELIRTLGRGGMGTVFLARDNKLGRRVAIKFLNAQTPDDARRFVLEARATARCSHENIVVLYEADEVQGQPYMVLEYLEGMTLTKLIKGRQLAPGRAVELVVPVVRALACAHAQGIVHRDLKPDNIFVTDAGTIKVLDFGIAKVLRGEGRAAEQAAPAAGAEPSGPAVGPGADTASSPFEQAIADLTSQGAIVGSLPYMAPEQWGLPVPIDPRADLWAVGVILFRMLAGKHPLEGRTGPALAITARRDVPMPGLKSVAPDVPQELCDVVDRCLKKYKEERYPDAPALLRALEPFLPGRFRRELKVDESPYAGLAPFQESDAGHFFGRTAEIAAFVGRVRERPLAAVVGPSGVGKSSFVRAGVVPALKGSGEAWEVVVLRPGRDPLGALASALAPMVSTSSSVASDLKEQRDLLKRLREEPGLAGAVLRSRARRAKRSLLVFVDQLEELYTLVADPRERRAFTACLAGVADDATSPTRVAVSLRSDFLDRVAEDPAFTAELAHGLFFLGPPSAEGMRDALVQPAQMAGYQFETPAIVESMLDHLRATQGALPLLQFAALRLWEARDPANKVLSAASYEAMGGIAGALASHADSVLSELSPPARALAKALLLRLVTPERTRAVVSLDELRELTRDAFEVGALVDRLVQARLLVAQTGGGAATAELVHESLVHSWPTLRRWLDESGEDAAFLEQLRAAAKQWQAKGRSADLLFRGETVEEAHRFRRRRGEDLPPLLSEYLDAVFAHESRAARRSRALTVGGLVFLSLLVAASAVALIVVRRAQSEAVRQAAAARKAEGLARDAEAAAEVRLDEVQRKERERAQAARQAEEAGAALQEKNREILDALGKAEAARRRAKASQAGAEENARLAQSAREEALHSARELEALLTRERDRVLRLQEQLGSPVIDTLK